MKRKFSRILGVGLSLMLLASLMVVATPVSAGTLSWSAETIPSATNKVIETATINDYAIAADGLTIYAALTTNKLYKSTNGGVAWTALTSPSANTTDLVAIAPGNDNMVVVVGTTALGAPEVWITINAGSSWTSLGTPTNAAGALLTAVSAVAISPVVAGVTNVAVGGAFGIGVPAISYFNYGAVVTKWVDAAHATAGDWADNIAMGATALVRAIAFSPSFASDRVIGVVTGNATGGPVLFQVGSFASKMWNANVSGYTGYPVSLVPAGGVTALIADLEFAPSYLGADTTTRIVFIGTMETGGANAPGGIYRLDDATVTTLKKTVGIRSVAYNAAAGKLVAGETGSNAVWRSANPLATTPTVTASGSTYKKPGVDLKTTNVMVAWAGTNVLAGSGGTDGGFSISRNDGTTFNDISLVTTPMTNIVDVAIKADGTTKYLLTNDGADMSVWRYVTGWERVRAFTPVTLNYIVRLAPEDANVVYLAETGTMTIWQSTNGGETWTLRYSTVNVQDLAVESASVIYAAEVGTKNVVKSTNGGFTWSDTPIDTKLAGGNNYMLASIAKDQVIVGSTTGYVSYSADGGTSWTAISAVTIAGNVQVTADKLTTGGFIYAASSTAAGDVRRIAIGGTSWTDITSGVTGNNTGIGLSGGVLYVISTNGTDSYMYREIAPSTATSTTVWSSVNSTGVFSRPPQALKLTSAPKLWAIDTEPAADTLQSLDDTVSKSTAVPAITTPADLTRVSVNPQTGFATDVVYQWARLSSATAYELQIAYDSAFTQLITTRVITSSATTVVTVIGPSSAGIADAGSTGTLGTISYQPNTTYYWRVRASAPLYSPYSTTRSIVTGTAVAFSIASPAVGATNVPVKATLVWTEYAGAINYEVEVSTDPTFATLDESRTTLTTFFQFETALAHSTTYYWRARGVTGPAPAKARAPGGPWLNGVFTTEAKPVEAAPPVIVQQPTAPEVKIVEVPVTTTVPAAIPSYLLWAIIVIGAVLIIALIVLIVRTRRVA